MRFAGAIIALYDDEVTESVYTVAYLLDVTNYPKSKRAHQDRGSGAQDVRSYTHSSDCQYTAKLEINSSAQQYEYTSRNIQCFVL